MFVSSSSPVFTWTSSYFLLLARDSSYSLADSVKDFDSFSMNVSAFDESLLAAKLNNKSAASELLPFELIELVEATGSEDFESDIT